MEILLRIPRLKLNILELNKSLPIHHDLNRLWRWFGDSNGDYGWDQHQCRKGSFEQHSNEGWTDRTMIVELYRNANERMWTSQQKGTTANERNKIVTENRSEDIPKWEVKGGQVS
jgi:phospholipase C